MATADQITQLRRLINQPDNVAPWTDEALGEQIDALGVDPDLRFLAGTIWTEKAASYTSLVDVKEGNSDRKLSQLHKQALAMAASFGVGGEEDAPRRKSSRTRQIERQ